MKIINPIIDPKINLAKKNFFSNSFKNKIETSAVKEAKELVDFTIEKNKAAHTFWIKKFLKNCYNLLMKSDTGKIYRNN
ncbi:hypothetical protein DBB36_04885 [Flavobacterium sp. WLB]|uniref:hypothetical protein n=1 Tax=unclassified Flavobacterium TaxID=196869 RepID=UPI0006AB8460|nr:MULTISPECIES: hypothetical protein [unclassified Flavobacterium]KOP39883.1 hypothetical protein AKO67_03145 [Flavobacterium sp. VMW]OWU92680.1 hypothetical protein APR43_01065 [Flavobacterium sp. NLM]PUU71196.1 hypothetical protein DBB36_04885 [Flavobacterium sp. WLB]